MHRVQVMQPKKREEIFFKGKKGLPLLVFIHGMGMNASAWADPAKARFLAGTYPLSVLFRAGDTELLTSFQDLKVLGYNILTWTQSRPAGPIHIAVSELHALLKEYRMHAGDGIIFICHSRGGLIARKYLGEGDLSARALITLATPHRGTTMARWATFFQPFTSALDTLLSGFNRKYVDSAFRRVIAFLGSSGLQEMLPGSVFYRDLKDRRSDGSVYISAGGTNPDLLSPIGFPIAEFMSRVVPGRLVPEELRAGEGDGLVSAASAMLPHADEHRNFHINHVAMLFDKEVRNFVVEKVAKASG